MKVRAAWDFTEHQLRTIRASYRRGGKATRKETVLFINRAVAEALQKAPDPAPARRRQPKPEPKAAPAPLTEAGELAQARARRDGIARHYRHVVPPWV